MKEEIRKRMKDTGKRRKEELKEGKRNNGGIENSGKRVASKKCYQILGGIIPARKKASARSSPMSPRAPFF